MNARHPDIRPRPPGPSTAAQALEADRLEREHIKRLHEARRRDDDDRETPGSARPCKPTR